MRILVLQNERSYTEQTFHMDKLGVKLKLQLKEKKGKTQKRKICC